MILRGLSESVRRGDNETIVAVSTDPCDGWPSWPTAPARLNGSASVRRVGGPASEALEATAVVRNGRARIELRFAGGSMRSDLIDGRVDRVELALGESFPEPAPPPPPPLTRGERADLELLERLLDSLDSCAISEPKRADAIRARLAQPIQE